MAISLLFSQSLVGRIIHTIPHDAAAIMGYLMIALFAAVLVLGSMTRKRNPPPTTGPTGGSAG